MTPEQRYMKNFMQLLALQPELLDSDSTDLATNSNAEASKPSKQSQPANDDTGISFAA